MCEQNEILIFCMRKRMKEQRQAVRTKQRNKGNMAGVSNINMQCSGFMLSAEKKSYTSVNSGTDVQGTYSRAVSV